MSRIVEYCGSNFEVLSISVVYHTLSNAYNYNKYAFTYNHIIYIYSISTCIHVG